MKHALMQTCINKQYNKEKIMMKGKSVHTEAAREKLQYIILEHYCITKVVRAVLNKLGNNTTLLQEQVNNF